MILPYVYVCTHRETGEFYTGYRSANKVNAAADLGATYRSSARYVSTRWEEFDSVVIAEFFDKRDAWLFEQQYIYDNRHNPLILNRTCHHNAVRVFIGPTSHCEETINKMKQSYSIVPARAASRKGRSWEDLYGAEGAEYRRTVVAKKISEAQIGKVSPNKGKPSPNKGKPSTRQYDEPWNKGLDGNDPRVATGIEKMLQARRDKNTQTWNKGKQQEIVMCPHCGKTGGHISMKRYHFDKCAERIVENFLNTDR